MAGHLERCLGWRHKRRAQACAGGSGLARCQSMLLQLVIAYLATPARSLQLTRQVPNTPEAFAAYQERAQANAYNVDYSQMTDDAFFKQFINCTAPEERLEPADDPSGKLSMVHVAYSSDTPHLQGVLLSMTSLARHLREPKRCVIHLIVSDADYEPARRLLDCFAKTPGAKPFVSLHRLRPLPARFESKMASLKERQKWRADLVNPHTFLRFYLHEYLPGVPRVLWLDADTVVRTDVAPLYRMRMKHPIALLSEVGQIRIGMLGEPAKIIGKSRWSYEYNTGVAVLDLNKWRAENLTVACELMTDKANARGGEQVGLNLALFDRMDVIKDWRWNTRGFNIKQPPELCMKEAKILHWSGKPGKVVKPWRIDTSDPEQVRRWRYDLVAPYIMEPRCPIEPQKVVLAADDSLSL